MKTKLFILILALQTLFLAGLAVTKEIGLRTGQTILLETRPVDPRDLLRGDYVVLSYDISQIPWDKFQPALTNELPVGSRVFVLLAEKNGFHQIVSASTNKPDATGNFVLLTGTTEYSWTNLVRATFGLERFYVKEGTGNPEGKLTVQAKVNKSGEALIHEVFINGKPYRDVMREK